jgi:PAS domain S-box-containing protein
VNEKCGEGTITHNEAGTNNSGTSLVGWPRYEALGRNVTEVFIFEKEGSVVPARGWLDHALQQGIPIRFDDGHFLKARNGKKLPVSGSVSPIRDDDNTKTGWVIVFRDVSALLEAKNEKRRIEEKMREAQRLKSLGAALLESEKQILAVSEAERRRIGADLHDNPTLLSWPIILHQSCVRTDLSTVRHQVPPRSLYRCKIHRPSLTVSLATPIECASICFAIFPGGVSEPKGNFSTLSAYALTKYR